MHQFPPSTLAKGEGLKEFVLFNMKDTTEYEANGNPELFTPVPDNRLNTEKTQIKMKNGLSPKR